MSEEYSVGYSEGYQAGWNAAMDATPPAQPAPVQEPEIDGATMAGMDASIGHLSALVDELRILLGCAMDNFKMLHNAAKPDDGPDMDAIIPAIVFAKFVNQDAALRYAIKRSAHDGMIATPPAAQPAIVLQQAYRTSDAYTIGFKDGQAAQPAPVQEILAAFPLFDEQGLDEEKHHCEWTLLQDRKRLHAMLAAPAAQPAPVQPVAWIEHHKGGDNLEWDNPGGKCTPLYTTPPARPAPVLEGRDWSLLEATQESLREHMTEIKRLKEAQPAVPDAIGPNEDELPAYAAGWNDCRAEMLKGMK